MKKQFNVKGTKFTVNVDVQTEDFYETIPNDYKKILYLLGQVSQIGAQLDNEFTTRGIKIDKRKWILQNDADLGENYLKEILRQNECSEPIEELNLTKGQKETIIETINSTMWWFKALKNSL